MQKIANTIELQTALQRILVKASETTPSRNVIAADLLRLAEEVVAGVEVEEDPQVLYNTTLAKLMQRLKKDAGAEKIAQNYRGTGSQKARRQLWVRFKSGAVIDLWLNDKYLGFGGVVMNRSPGSEPAPLPKGIPYGDKDPEQIYKEAAALLKVWANP